MVPFLILFLVFALILLGLMWYTELPFLGYLASLIFLITGVYTMSNGFLDQIDWFTRSISVILIGIGMYLTVVISFGMIEDHPESEY